MVGTELQKTRPCLVVSPPELNDALRTVIVAPITTGSKPAKYRVPIVFDGKHCFVLLDQLRTLDKIRLVKRLGFINAKLLATTLATLQEVFAP